ncbi:mannose-6-phosphate isomerase-like protein (cupin superfamily) [Caulobacter ginsengisoli]|uniref:Mannose-6-phosphate isomerase-like protein (Cupin superfamily) n=1 Tax=Caulobacter ginsengisoli TaxID=400775 RepID=A0ABU0ISW5_9CAUL|nr:cupin domain-containing protein [Caulobacter ginsengisoli]MDQ0465099.1 mannose-6-phosphate isomerase-like protein (cupin superfamily) [Caulobacter ginsengisoli]
MIVTTAGGVSFEDGPDRARIIVSGEDTGGRYSLMEWTVAPSDQTGFGAHRHGTCEETFLIRSGRLEFLLGETVTTLGPGDFVRAPAGTRHGYRNSSGAPVEMLVGFVPAGMEGLFVKYRTDGDGPEAGEGFVADATRLFESEFEA